MKYADLSTSANRDYKFDLDQMVSLNGDTSVYLQYAYARIQSILRKAGDVRPAHHRSWSCTRRSAPSACTSTPSRETVAEAAREYALHKLTAYLYQLASLFTSFYDKCPVIKPAPPQDVAENRLFLSDVTARTCTGAWPCWASGPSERL